MKTRTFSLILIFVFPLLVAFTQVGERFVQDEDDVPGFYRFSSDWFESGRSIVDQVSDSTITEMITRLVDFRTRYSCTDSNWAAGQWIYDKFLEFGFTDVSFDSFPFDVGGFPCDVQRSIVAVKEGILDPDKVIVIGGHYDSSVTHTAPCDPDTLAPGADDNASGTVATLEAARVLSGTDTEKTLIFIAFGAEEQTMGGSYNFAEEAFNQGMDITLMINLDMVANVSDYFWDIDLWADAEAMRYAQVVADMAILYTGLIPVIYEGHYAGDNSSFENFGYNTVYAAESDFSPHYHDCTDIVENLNIPYMTDVTRMIIPSILYFSEVPEVPSGFDAVNVGDGTSLFLSWDPNDELDLAGYHIYWGTQTGVYDSVKTVSIAWDTLRNLLEGETYYLAVSAFDTDDNESYLTAEAEITCSSVPLPPIGIATLSTDSAIVITWERNESELDLAGYNVYRREVGGAPDTVLLGFIPDPTTTYFDRAVEPHILYGYHVTALDTEDPPSESDPSEEVFGRLTTYDMGILVVDNTRDGWGAPLLPTDEEVEAFYADILGDYNVQGFWDVDDSLTVGRVVMDYDLGIYSVVLWHSDVRESWSETLDKEAMERYLDGGGNLWLSGWQFLAFLDGWNSNSYYRFDSGDFEFEFMGIDSARTTSTADQDCIGFESLVSGFPSIEVDLEKMVPVGAFYNTEVLLEPFDGAYPLYAYVSSDSTSSKYHGMPVAVASNSEDYGLVFTDFPLYFMEQVDAVMEMFGEPVGVGDEEVVKLPRAFALSQNYPNPFNPSTTIGTISPPSRGQAFRM